MSINEIKDINKLRQMLTESKAQEKYLKECCRKAGEELAKHSFDYDSKEKNLVVQAKQLNEIYEKVEKALDKIKECVTRYKEQCNTPNSCVDNRLCSTCFLINEIKGDKQ